MINLPPTYKFKGIIFDLFHTLTTLFHTNAPGGDSAAMLGIEREKWVDALFNLSDARLRGETKDYVKMIASVALQLDPTIPHEKIKATASDRAKRFSYCLKNAPKKSIDIISQLKKSGKKIGLVSNADAMERAGWENTEIGSLFDSSIFSCDVGLVKPEHDIFKLCLNELNLDPSEVLFVGDGGSNELVAAREVGMKSCFTSQLIKDLWPQKIEILEKDGDYQIEDLNQLLTNI